MNVFEGPAYYQPGFVPPRHAERIETIEPFIEALRFYGVEILTPRDRSDGISAKARQLWVPDSFYFFDLAQKVAEISKRVSFVPLVIPRNSVDRACEFSKDGVIVRYVRAYIIERDEMGVRWDVLIVPED